MKVLFVLPTFRRGRNLVPLGPAYIASALLNQGHDIQVIDADAFEYTREDLKALFRKMDYDVVAMGGIATAYNFVKRTAEDIKQIRPNTVVITGGKMVTPAPELIMQNSMVDIGIIGEAEITMVELLKAMECNEPLKNVKGIIFKDARGLVKTENRELIKDLDTLPFPARDYFYMEEVYSRVPFSKNIFDASRTANISTGRGCPYACTFCSYDRVTRLRSVNNIMAELEDLKKRYNIGSFTVDDELFLIDRKRAVEFCNQLIRSGMGLKWKTSGRVNLVDKEILRLLRRAGCVKIAYGIESGSPRMLKRMKKQITPKQVDDAICWTIEAGLQPGGTWIIGLPGEDKDSIEETKSLYKRISKYRTFSNPFFFATPYPGTELYDEMKKLKRIVNEDEYMESISRTGDAVKFLINCTDKFTDNELMSLKRQLDAELKRYVMNKHKTLSILRSLSRLTGIEALNKFAILVKVQGIKFVLKKIVAKFTHKSPYGKPYL